MYLIRKRSVQYTFVYIFFSFERSYIICSKIRNMNIVKTFGRILLFEFEDEKNFFPNQMETSPWGKKKKECTIQYIYVYCTRILFFRENAVWKGEREKKLCLLNKLLPMNNSGHVSTTGWAPVKKRILFCFWPKLIYVPNNTFAFFWWKMILLGKSWQLFGICFFFFLQKMHALQDKVNMSTEKGYLFAKLSCPSKRKFPGKCINVQQ